MSSPIKTHTLPIKPEICNADYTRSKNKFNISEFINPIFNKAKDLYCHYIESPACLIANAHDTLIQKTIKASNWIFETSPITFIETYFQDIQYFNPFNSKTSNLLTTPLDTTADVSIESKEPSSKDFEISAPIIIDHTTSKIDKTAFSIEQIKKDLDRIEIFVNNFRCNNIESFAKHLGLTLISNKTDILATRNSLISKILHFSHQGLFSQASKVFNTYVNQQYANAIPSQNYDEKLALYINYNPKFPEKTEIFGELSFNIKSLDSGKTLPHVYYTVKTKHSLDKEEISWEAIKKESSNELENSQENDIESSFVMVDFPAFEDAKELDDEFVMLEPSMLSNDTPDMESLEDSTDNEFESITLSDEDAINTDLGFHTTLDSLLNDTNSAIKSGTTSEYLNSIKNKYPNFIYNDRLMYGNVPITTDKIINFLNDLKNDHPSNQVIFLPFLVKGLIKGWSVDHAVVAVLNLSNETIEYFDPKG